MSLINVKNVVKDYPLGETVVHAVRGVDLSIEAGEFLSVVGTSGSGKTTLLNMIGLIDKATSGEITIDGQAVDSLADLSLTRLRLNTVGFIFQTFNLIPVLNVIENIEFPLMLKKDKSEREIRLKAEELAESVGLTEFIAHRPSELSGGQRQRVAIARALVADPKIVLADEPTANLDTETGETILNLMREMNEKRKTTFIFSTHDPEVMKYARRKVEMRDGKIVA